MFHGPSLYNLENIAELNGKMCGLLSGLEGGPLAVPFQRQFFGYPSSSLAARHIEPSLTLLI
jgi:hypothetical protein